MPSHIFSILGMWHDVITSNTATEASSKAYAAKNLPGQTLWLHAQDFRIHAHLQLAQDQEAKRIVDERNTIEKLVPVRLPNETAFAAIPVRYIIERGTGLRRRRWSRGVSASRRHRRSSTSVGRSVRREAETWPVPAVTSRSSRRCAIPSARRRILTGRSRSRSSAGQLPRGARAEGRPAEAVVAMRSAADLEDASEKHIAMENRLVPMRELLGELLLEVHEPAAALAEFEASLQRVPNRFRSFAGAARAAELAGDREKAKAFSAKPRAG